MLCSRHIKKTNSSDKNSYKLQPVNNMIKREKLKPQI